MLKFFSLLQDPLSSMKDLSASWDSLADAAEVSTTVLSIELLRNAVERKSLVATFCNINT